jgi:sugar lactone lactonase YvrE
MKIYLKAILISLVTVACLSVGTVSTARADSDDLFASINGSPGNGAGFIYQYTPAGAQSTFLSGLNRPRGLAFHSAGDLFLATNTSDANGVIHGTIVRIAPDGTTTTFATGFGDNVFLEQLAFDSAGNIFVNSSNIANPDAISGTVFKILPDGTVITFGTVPGQAFGVAVDSSNNVFAASAGTDRTIYRFTPAGVRTVFVGPAAFTAPQGPVGLTFDSSGNLFVSASESGTNGEILKFAPDGTKTVFATGLTNGPRGLAFDRGGNLFVAEVPPMTTGDILKFSPTGVRTTFASGIGNPGGNGGPEYLTFNKFCGCVGPAGPPGPQGPPGIGFSSGGTQLVRQGAPAPAGFNKIGTTTFQYRDLNGKNQSVTLDVYQRP